MIKLYINLHIVLYMKLILGRSDASGEDLFLAFSLMMHTASRFLKTELTPRKVVHAGEDFSQTTLNVIEH